MNMHERRGGQQPCGVAAVCRIDCLAGRSGLGMTQCGQRERGGGKR